MPEDSDFRQLIRRVRAGDDTAAAELVRRYEPAIRRIVRIRLRDSRLRRAFDSMDVCQSVLASFFARAALGQYDLESPEQLLKLLASMARNKVVNAAKHQQAQCRDHRRVEGGDPAEREVPTAEATPSRQLAMKDLLQQFRQRLDADELRLVELRSEGHEWASIAEHLGSTPEAVRKRHARAVERVARELGLEEVEGD